MTDDFPVLTAARVVTRHCLPEGDLPHVERLLDAFLDAVSSRWTLVQAYKKEKSLRLLQYIAARRPPDQVDPFYRRWVCNATSWFVACQGDITALQWLVEKCFPSETLSAPVYAAAAHGHVEILTYLFQYHPRRTRWGCIEMCGALENNQGQVFDWLKTHFPPRRECLKLVLQAAAKTGNLNAIQWFYNDCNAAADDAFVQAQKSGQWEIARWLLTHCEVAELRVNWDAAATHGELSFMQYVHFRGNIGARVSTLVDAALNGHLEVVKWLHEELGVPLTAGAMRRAAENGHLKVVKWLHDAGCEQGDAWAMDSASRNGHLGVVEWLHHNRDEGCSWKAMTWAAERGHLSIVQWLHANRTEGCTMLAMDFAAANGFLNVVEWLHENRTEGCSSEAMDGAAREGHLDVVQWLHEFRKEGCTPEAMDFASSKGHLEVVKWLHANRSEGCSVMAMDWAAGNGHLEVVQWLHHNRSEGCTYEAMACAAVKGHLDMVKWLHRNRSEGCSPNTLSKVAAAGNLEMVKWLYENRSEVDADLAMREAVLRGRFDVVMYLHSKSVEVKTFGNTTIFQRPCFGLIQWLVGNFADQVHDCTIEVPTWDWRFNDWCQQMNMQRARHDEDITLWIFNPDS